MRPANILLVVMLSAIPGFCQSLPDKPQPQSAEKKEFWIETGAMETAYTMDILSASGAITKTVLTKMDLKLHMLTSTR